MTGDDLDDLDAAARRELAGQMLASVFAADRRVPGDLDEQDLYALAYDEVDAARAAGAAALARGLADSAAGRVTDLGDFTQYADDEDN